tara:strand:- start:210 stop:446 length:237 start_codon:yes stop_codon:yes gene_type:complete
MHRVSADITIEGVTKNNGEARFYLVDNKKESKFVEIDHDLEQLRFKNEGVVYKHFVKEFSEAKGSKWVLKKEAFCEEQ